MASSSSSSRRRHKKKGKPSGDPLKEGPSDEFPSPNEIKDDPDVIDIEKLILSDYSSYDFQLLTPSSKAVVLAACEGHNMSRYATFADDRELNFYKLDEITYGYVPIRDDALTHLMFQLDFTKVSSVLPLDSTKYAKIEISKTKIIVDMNFFKPSSLYAKKEIEKKSTSNDNQLFPKDEDEDKVFHPNKYVFIKAGVYKIVEKMIHSSFLFEQLNLLNSESVK